MQIQNQRREGEREFSVTNRNEREQNHNKMENNKNNMKYDRQIKNDHEPHNAIISRTGERTGLLGISCNRFVRKKIHANDANN